MVSSHNPTPNAPNRPPMIVPMHREVQLEDDIVSGSDSGSGVESVLEDPFRIEFLKCVKEIHTRMDHIPGASLVLKGTDSKKYTQLPYKPSATPMLTLKSLRCQIFPNTKVQDIIEHLTTYTTTIKGNDLTQDMIETIMVKKFGETLTKVDLMWYSLLP
ncbi:hypothetical protein HAX54_022353 [Datura stramonium]|uniref:Uncharacterized protein n=1 Tax=Datura stramonium TaxID=4076 RepID=A0ABS8S4J9_DATST|nr:hypothetical protein [Datura stramonium]